MTIVKKHDIKLHDPNKGGKIHRASKRFLETLATATNSRGIVIAIEPCGCVNINATLPESDVEAALMQLLATRETGERDH